MIVVSDTSAVTSLLQIGRAQLLADLYEHVAIPAAVERELRCHHPILPVFLSVSRVVDTTAVARLQLEIDRGEAEAIVLAKEIKADALLIDERIGRAVALREGVPIIGLVGVLIAAKRSALIPSLANLLDELEINADFRIAAHLKAGALRAVGE
jgi:uncharacterized protein